MKSPSVVGAQPAVQPTRSRARQHSHLLLLTRLEDAQMARLREAVADYPKTLISRDQAAAREAHVPVTAVIGGPPPELVEHLHHLDWVQLRTDCLDGWEESLRLLADRGVTVTRTRGSYNDTVPDHTLMLILALARDLPTLLQQRRTHEWRGDRVAPLVLGGATLGLIGLGAVAAEVARRARVFGMRVVAVDPAPVDVPAAVERVVGPDKLYDVLEESDLVVLSMPANRSTVGLIDAVALGHMKPTAGLINVGRGLVVNTEDLLHALDEGVIAGAALDVADPYPLPEDHPLWEHPRVLLTCHTAQKGSHFAATQFEGMLENVRRYLRGDELLNEVKPEHWA